ncbi:FAS-associated death domain protein [Rhinoraja longicauda]
MAAGEGMRFNTLLNDISQSLSQEELGSMKFMCRGHIGKRRLENLGSGLQLFQVLEERGMLSQEDTQFLADLLKTIERPDLEKKLSTFHSQGEGHLQQPTCEAGPNSHDLNVAIDVIRDNIGREWRKLARQLGFKEAQLQEIEYRYPRDMQCQIVSTLTSWQEKKGPAACVDDLVDALRCCKFTMVADTVEEVVNKSR